MGFGYLIIGFVMMLDTGLSLSDTYNVGIDVFPDIIGYLCMVRSMVYLRKSYRDLNVFSYIAKLLCLLGAAVLVFQITALVMSLASLAGLETVSQILLIFGYIKNPLMLAATLFLARGLRELAVSVGLAPLAKRATVSALVSAAYYLIQSVFTMGAFSVKVPAVFVYGAALLFYVQLVLMITLSFSFYRQIGFEGEDSLPEKEHPLQRLMKNLSKYKNDD